MKVVKEKLGVSNSVTPTVKVTTWAWAGVQLKVVVPCGAVFVGAMLASVVGLLLSVQNSTLVAEVVFVTET
jgi:hypothetical protein